MKPWTASTGFCKRLTCTGSVFNLDDVTPFQGTILSCINWSGKAIAQFTVTVNTPEIPAFKTGMLASTGKLLTPTNKTSFTFELRITADVVVLR